MAAKDTAKDLAVYVIGKSGKCSTDYIGCGKSCLCRQYMYNEYVEESYSTLLQSEFDGCVINQQHVIYWGKKEELYKEMTKGQCSFMAKVNFEVFEHTIFYQDGINQPFRGSNNYENRVFSPLKSYLNKYSFRSRDDVLNPEDYDSKTFSYSHVVLVAYLYVIDVSQSCPVFEEQLQMMSKLVKDIHKKKQTCVVVATKFDTHSRANLERLESLANKLKLTVIQCSAKYNTNINLAFKYLAAKALHLKKLSVDLLTHAEAAVQKRVENPTEDETDDINLDIIPHITMANKSRPFSMLERRPTKDYEEPPDTLRRDTYMSGDYSDDSYDETDDEFEKNSKILSNPKNATKMVLTSSPLESSVNHSVTSDPPTVTPPSDGVVTEKMADTMTVQKDIQDHAPDDKGLSSDDTEQYINGHIDFERLKPVKDNYKVQEKSPYLEIISAGNEAVTSYDNDKSEYYELWEVRKLVTAHGPDAATVKSDASVNHSSTTQLHHRDTKTVDANLSAMLSEQSLYDDKISEQKCLAKLRSIDSTSSNYVRMYTANHPGSKRNSDTYDYACHSYVEMRRYHRRCTGVPPRRVTRIGYQPPIFSNTTHVKENENTYVNFRIIKPHVTLLPPREKCKKSTGVKECSNFQPQMPPRNVPRPRCYLSGPLAIPQ